jgi:hypothetical protein
MAAPEASPPETPALRIPGSGAATAYALNLIQSLGRRAESRTGPLDCSSADAWARSGAMDLTGEKHGPALAAPAPIATCADGAGRALVALAREATGTAPTDLDGAALLGERAALAEPPLERAGRTSPGGSAQILSCADGWLALNLARPEDVALVPAWLEADPARGNDPWPELAACVATRARDELVVRGREMGMAVAAVAASRTPSWCRIDSSGRRRQRPTGPPLVVDLSALWAGPLCGQLLAACGARVIKVESLERPDGARRGSTAFFHLLNAEKESVALSIRNNRDRLDALLARADIVIESSRPRALRQLGLRAESYVEEHAVTWVSITGYGRREPEAGWVAFGDDAAAAAGLVATTSAGHPCFCGDAIADPLTGLHAALAALAAWSQGGARLLDVSLHGVAGHVARFPAAPGRRQIDPAPPRARAIQGQAAENGRDTERVLRELGIPC